MQKELVRGRWLTVEDALSCESCSALLHDDEAEDGKTCPNCGVVFDEENDEESDYV